MGRMTRAKAAEVAEKLHIDEDALLELPIESAEDANKTVTPKEDERMPLGEIAPNSGGSKDEDSEVAELKKSTRGRKAGRKGRKAETHNQDPAADTSTPLEDSVDEAPHVVENSREVTMSPLSGSAPNSPRPDVECADGQLHDSEPQRAQSPEARLTRRQLAKQGQLGDDKEASVCSNEQTAAAIMVESDETLHVNEKTEKVNEEPRTTLDAPASPLPSAMPNVIKSLRKDTPGMRSTSNKENVEPAEAILSPRMGSNHRRISTYDALEQAVVNASSPATASTQPSDQALSVGEQEVTAARREHIEPEHTASPTRTQPNSPTPVIETANDAADRKMEVKEPIVKEAEVKEEQPRRRTTKPAAVVRSTKASQARISMAHPEKTGAGVATRSRPSSIVGRPTGKLTKSTQAETRVASRGKKLIAGTTSENDQHREKKEAVIPHSKPRPISISFPTPPPPSKSKKAPTSSTFQLPGEAVAAKLKAAREARLAKEAEAAQKSKDAHKEEAKKPAFKARPVPASLKQAPSVRPTNASKARESLMSSVKPGAAPPVVGAHRRASSVVTSTRTSSSVSRPAMSKLSGSEQPVKVAKRPSTAMADMSKVRASTASTDTTAKRVPSTGTAKGKEVFHRAAASKAAAEREKKEKEEAAKKARAAAAERGRQLSKEWAEKQRLKKLRLKPEAKKHDSVQNLGGPEVVAGLPGKDGGVQAEAVVAEMA